MKVLAKMSTNIVSVSVDDDIATAYDHMVDGNFRHVPVVDDGIVVGILSDRDILLHATGGRFNMKVPALPVVDVMSRNPITCLPGTDVAQAAAIMLERRIDCLPVVTRDNVLIGMFTSADVLDMAACAEDESLNIIETEATNKERTGRPDRSEEDYYRSPFHEMGSGVE